MPGKYQDLLSSQLPALIADRCALHQADIT
jgi:hypothetical protein